MQPLDPRQALVQPGYSSSRASLSTDTELLQAYRANALFDAHHDDPEFGYRCLVEEARDAGKPMAERTAWRICSNNGWWSVFGKRKRGKNGKVCPPVHDDLVRRDFTAEAPNRLWLTDITEHRTAWVPVVVATLHEGWRCCWDRSTARNKGRSSLSCSTGRQRKCSR